MSIISIIEGNLRYAFNIRSTIMVYREEEYCMNCPIAHTNGKYTGQCNKELGGCGCGVGAKTSQNKDVCPKGFWGSNWFKPELFKEFLNEENGK